jgi:murein DD-endopeptidase MepM/ murein hydrolase activator NlpD
MTTYCYPYRRGTGWRSQEFRSHPESPFNPPGGHTGFDQAMDAGTPIYSPADGIVRNSSWLTENYLANPWWLTRYGGDTLVIDATDSFGRTDTMPTFIIAHLQDSIPEVGTRVKKGQLVAYSGNSGTATTGPHAHVEVLPPGWDWNNGVYGRVDPELYFTEYPEDIAAGGAALAPQSNSTKPTTGGLTVADINSITKQLNEIKAALAPINTSTGPVDLRQFIANGTRAAQAAEKQTAPINVSGGKQEGIRDFIAKGTRASQQTAAKLAGLEAALKAVVEAAGSPVDLAAVTAAAEAGATKALSNLSATVTLEQGPTNG